MFAFSDTASRDNWKRQPWAQSPPTDFTENLQSLPTNHEETNVAVIPSDNSIGSSDRSGRPCVGPT